MGVIQSTSMLVEATDLGWYDAAARTGVLLYNDFAYDYATLYRTQPNVRTCVDFLARNIAQLGIHVFERAGDTDRRRLTDHPLALLLEQPLPPAYKVTRYRLIESLVADLGIYFNAYWIKVPRDDGRRQMGLMRIPPTLVTVQGGLVPTSYEVQLSRGTAVLQPEFVVHFRGYNAESAVTGLSPLETLRRVLAEEHAAGEYREYFWRNSARMGGFVERPADAPAWSDEARERFKLEFAQLYGGAQASGKTAVLEEGMTWKPGTFSAQDSEYLAGRKLTREECARAYHIPLPMVGILDHATLTNIREQHRNLYQDCLGPWCEMIQQEIELQLLPELGPSANVYVEFNIADKLKGDFEEQTQALQAAVGRPWMTADEARARMNLPGVGGDADALVTPLNVLVGGQASPQDVPGVAEQAVEPVLTKARGEIDPTLLETRKRHEAKWTQVLQHTFERQRAAVIGKVPRGVPAPSGEAKAQPVVVLEQLWDQARWNRELQADIVRMNRATAGVWARWVADQLALALDETLMAAWLDEHSRVQAEYINGLTRDKLAEALTQDDPRTVAEQLFDLAMRVRAPAIAVSAVTAAANFGAQEAARQGGLKWKVWQVNSSNPREMHAAMNGERVGIRERFSNGMRWPGDPAGGADNNSNCMCSVRFGR